MRVKSVETENCSQQSCSHTRVVLIHSSRINEPQQLTQCKKKLTDFRPHGKWCNPATPFSSIVLAAQLKLVIYWAAPISHIYIKWDMCVCALLRVACETPAVRRWKMCHSGFLIRESARRARPHAQSMNGALTSRHGGASQPAQHHLLAAGRPQAASISERVGRLCRIGIGEGVLDGAPRATNAGRRRSCCCCCASQIDPSRHGKGFSQMIAAWKCARVRVGKSK